MIYRVDVEAAGGAAGDGQDPQLFREVRRLYPQVQSVRRGRIFLMDTDADEATLRRGALPLLVDPVCERGTLTGAGEAIAATPGAVEVHLQAGVMDPVAESTERVLRDAGVEVRQVRTGRRVVIAPAPAGQELRALAGALLANEVIEDIHLDAWLPAAFPQAPERSVEVRRVAITQLDAAGLAGLSRSGHLFLSPDEMRAVQEYFRALGREPTDIELETIAQTWSEHCVHKTLKSRVVVDGRSADGKALAERSYACLIRDTLFASTRELMGRMEGFCLSVFSDNAGVIAFDDADAVCFKVETHNHPSAIEPYGGAATGAGGCIRDVLGTGLSAKPVANTDVFCVAYPDAGEEGARFSGLKRLPGGVIHPRRLLQQVVAGVRDYGNRMGIPTVNGAVYFDDGYLANPLVFCGCVGLIPRDKIHKQARAGDAIVVVGGRTGRDGIHGATFSSAELTSTHADEFSHAVQIGNAITQKKMADVILQARDGNLFSAITDCGADGLSSAVGEMGEKIGAKVQLERVPLKYAGLRYDEIWISEAQERMVLAVPPGQVDELLALCRGEDVEATVIGVFGTEGRELVLGYGATEVGRIAMEFLHDGLPMPSRRATVREGPAPGPVARFGEGLATRERLLNVLAHPNVASKHWVIRQYDHEVQGGSVIKPLTGPMQRGPSDAAVLRPKLGHAGGVALACGLTPQIDDPYWMAIAAIDEAIRNVVCVGARPGRIAILDNFCWESVDDAATMGNLVRACEGCRDGALAFGAPFISGKDSLHNQFTDRETGAVLKIPRTLLISAIAVIDDLSRCVTMDLKSPGNRLVLVEPAAGAWLEVLPKVHSGVADAIGSGLICSAHDVSDGGVLAALAEMCLAAGLGAEISLPDDGLGLFGESPGRYVLEVAHGASERVVARLQAAGAGAAVIGTVTSAAILRAAGCSWPVESLAEAFAGTLDW